MHLLNGFIVAVLIYSVIKAKLREQAYKLMFDLPWMKWLTLDDVVKMGHSRFLSKVLLPVFHRNGCLELRPREGLTELKQFEAEQMIRFPNGSNIELYEFRLIKRGRPRKEKVNSLLSLFPTFEPAHN